MCLCMNVCVCVRVFMYVCMNVCVYGGGGIYSKRLKVKNKVLFSLSPSLPTLNKFLLLILDSSNHYILF